MDGSHIFVLEPTTKISKFNDKIAPRGYVLLVPGTIFTRINLEILR
jgi:hypothetical protein